MITLMAFLLLTSLVLIAPPAAGQEEVPNVNPASVDRTVAPGEIFLVEKTVNEVPYGTDDIDFFAYAGDESDCELGISLSDIIIDGPEEGIWTASFTETITAPEIEGTYSCYVDFLAFESNDDVYYPDYLGFQTVTIEVTGGEEEPDVSCEAGEPCTFEGETYTGSIVCEDCDLFINDPGDNIADLTVLPNKGGEDLSFVITVISEDRPRRWWRTAGVFVYEGVYRGQEVTEETKVGRCSWRESFRWFVRGQEPARSCSIIIPLRGDRLKHILFWNDDPSFRFR
jgi:hypothetical protein